MSTTSTRPSIRILYTFPYRGGSQPWSNRFYFDGLLEPTDADFLNLYDQLQPDIEQCFDSSVEITGGVGYWAGSDVPVWTGGASYPGTMTPDTSQKAPGDCAAVLRYTTDQRSTKNHPIYLFNYFHSVWAVEGSDADTLSSRQHSRLTQIGTDWVAGYTIGSSTVKRCGPRGAVAQSAACLPMISHRDFPR